MPMRTDIPPMELAACGDRFNMNSAFIWRAQRLAVKKECRDRLRSVGETSSIAKAHHYRKVQVLEGRVHCGKHHKA